MSSSSKKAFKDVIASIYAAINDNNIENARQLLKETECLGLILDHERFGATFREVSGLSCRIDNPKKWNTHHKYWRRHKNILLEKIDNAQQSQQSPQSLNSETMVFSFVSVDDE